MVPVAIRALRALALVLVPTVAAAAQGPGPVAPDGRRLRTGRDSLAIFVVRGRDTVRTGLVRDELSVAREGGREVLRRVYTSVDEALGARVDTLVDDLETLAPVRHRSLSTRSQEVVDFAPGRASGWVRPANADSVAVSARLPSAVYNASSFDLVLRASPLAEGWSAAVPAFLVGPSKVVKLTTRVAGVEPVAGEPCWRVEADFVGLPVTFWVRQADRALRQQVMRVGADTEILYRPAAPAAPRRSVGG